MSSWIKQKTKIFCLLPLDGNMMQRKKDCFPKLAKLGNRTDSFLFIQLYNQNDICHYFVPLLTLRTQSGIV